MTIGPVTNDNLIPNEAISETQSKEAPNTTFSTTLSNTLTSGNVDLDAIFEAAGQRYNISPNFLKAVAMVESSFRPHITGPSGAMGIMQLMPATAQYLGVTDPFDPEQNIMGGAKYLREQLDRFDGDVELALAAYNAGWPAVMRYGGIPPFRETQNYVPKVLEYFNGGELTAGMANYNSFGSDVRVTQARQGGSFDLAGALSQMMLMKLIEMQMRSSDDDKKIF